MAYPKKLLNDNEQVVLELKPHWWFLVPRLVLQILVLVVAVAVLVRVDVAAVQVLMGIGVLAALVYFGIRYAQWATTDFVVTSDRVIYRSGVLAKSGIEIPLERINTVVFNQGIFERMLGAGDLEIESAGDTPSHFSDIRRPDYVQAEIYRQMEGNENRKFDRLGGHVEKLNLGSNLSVAEQLEKLDELRSKGVLSEDEFAEQKAALLEGGT